MTERPGDMWRVDYPDDTGPLGRPLGRTPLSLEPPETEAATMVTDGDFVYVNRYGEDVAPDDPTAQTKFAPAELKALRKGGFFPKRDGQVVEAADASAGTPVLNSGVGKADDAEEHDVVDAKSADTSAAADADETADAPAHAASVKHGKR